MNVKNDINAFKGDLKTAVVDWVDEKVSDFVSSRPALKPMSVYLKRGVCRWIDAQDQRINKAMDSLLPLICDKDGTLDTDRFFDDLAEMFRLMDEHTSKMGIVNLVAGKGAVMFSIDHPLADMLLGGKGVRITVDELLEIKEMLKP